jgi:hypothetical protein
MLPYSVKLRDRLNCPARTGLAKLQRRGKSEEMTDRKQFMITNLMQIKEMLLLNSIMEFVWRMAAVFGWISRKQPIITNLLQIKEMLMLNSYMDFV